MALMKIVSEAIAEREKSCASVTRNNVKADENMFNSDGKEHGNYPPTAGEYEKDDGPSGPPPSDDSDDENLEELVACPSQIWNIRSAEQVEFILKKVLKI